jgi:hypothetical protein
MRLTLYFIFLIILRSQGQIDSLNCVNFLIKIDNDLETVEKFYCPVSNDSLIAVLNINNINPDIYLDRYKNYHVEQLWLLSDKMNYFPPLIQNYSNYLKVLWIWYPAVKKEEKKYFVHLDSLEELQLISKLKFVPMDFFYMKSLKSVYLIQKHNIKFILPDDYIGSIRFFSTNMKISKNNLTEISKMNLETLYLLKVKRINKKIIVLNNIPEIQVQGKLSSREQKRLNMLIPHAIYVESL